LAPLAGVVWAVAIVEGVSYRWGHTCSGQCELSTEHMFLTLSPQIVTPRSQDGVNTL
jgi:hypothetical protein